MEDLFPAYFEVNVLNFEVWHVESHINSFKMNAKLSADVKVTLLLRVTLTVSGLSLNLFFSVSSQAT